MNLSENDRMFVRACRDEIADGCHVVIVVDSDWKANAMADLFTDEELTYVDFRIGDVTAAATKGNAP